MLAWRGRVRLPFLVQRPALLLRDLLVNRQEPDLAGLEAVKDPEAFVWRVLPHAARTFSSCIALLPARLARASAVAYLYCRCLDSYEDLLPSHQQREQALRDFAERFEPLSSRSPWPAPSLDPSLARDARNRAHILLVNRCQMVDEVFRSLAPPIQGIILDLVRGMAEGMVWFSATFEQQQGVLLDADQVSRYIGYVLGLPTVFAARLLRFHHHNDPQLTPSQTEDALMVGEMVQLANITRDIEKDLLRGVAYDPRLRDGLGTDPHGNPDLKERIRQVREDFLLRALKLAPAYRRFTLDLDFPRFSLGRASTVLMLLFTDRYFR
ncbi:MAG: squalene/phytoene synthase family protein, partial [Acidobacteriota bacterium]